jgi:hypothetical protein
LKDGVWEPLTNEEMDKFELENPDIARYWKDPSTLDTIPLPKFSENPPLYECWDKAAKRMIASLWKSPSSWIFHDPVDPDKLGIPDYLEIVQTPMDFTIIKQRLNLNQYYRMQEFLDDV